MRSVTLEQIFEHPIAQKYINRSGMVHAIAVAYHALRLAKQHGLSVDAAVKAGFLHDIGHYTWYRDGKWDYDLYKTNDIHAVKGAERAHKLLIRLGEDPRIAKEIALAILLHTDSFLLSGNIERTSLQQIVKKADELDEEPGGMHHYRTISHEKAWKAILRLDRLVEAELANTAKLKDYKEA